MSAGAGSEPDLRRVIAIDGPAASGKSTVAREVARRLAIPFFDTGILYRLVTLRALRDGIDLTDAGALARIARVLQVAVGPRSAITVDGEPVGDEIRSAAVDAAVSQVSAHQAVRDALLPVQRAIGARGPVVMVGRDIATVVAPDAGVRIYLDASASERARRRWAELRQSGHDVPFEAIEAEMVRRDQADATRSVAPLRRAEGVTVIDTDDLDVEAVVRAVTALAAPEVSHK